MLFQVIKSNPTCVRIEKPAVQKLHLPINVDQKAANCGIAFESHRLSSLLLSAIQFRAGDSLHIHPYSHKFSFINVCIHGCVFVSLSSLT